MISHDKLGEIADTLSRVQEDLRLARPGEDGAWHGEDIVSAIERLTATFAMVLDLELVRSGYRLGTKTYKVPNKPRKHGTKTAE